MVLLFVVIVVVAAAVVVMVVVFWIGGIGGDDGKGSASADRDSSSHLCLNFLHVLIKLHVVCF